MSGCKVEVTAIPIPGSGTPSGFKVNVTALPAGFQGLKGDKGDTGNAGATGATGAKGDKGDPGASGSAPTGAILLYGAAAAPTGFLLCDGAAVSRSTYAALFAVIGTSFGVGNGTTTFNVPELRGRVPVGMGQGSGLTNRVLAATGGEETHIISVSEMPNHAHSNASGGGGSAAHAYQYLGSTGNATGQTTLVGGGGPHNNMPPFIVVNCIIKT